MPDDLQINKVMDDTVNSTSTKELKSMKKRINFYMTHFMTINNMKKNNISYEEKINFLSNLNSLLENELKKRTSLA